MVRMGQDWSLRYPLVDGQGNYGSIDGDSPAAMRYTEARLSRIAEEMLRDIDKETVDFQKNFDDTLDEPVVLPTRIPNLLVNGASGIAVGMATNMPPHNLTETINGIIAYIDNREITIEELMQYIKSPPTFLPAVIFTVITESRKLMKPDVDVSSYVPKQRSNGRQSEKSSCRKYLMA